MGHPENQVIALRGGAVEWTRLRKGRGGWEPDASGASPLPEGGDPLRLLALPSPEIVTALDAAARHMAGHHAIVALPGSCAIQRVAVLPATDPKELAGMVELQIDTLSPFPPETVAWSFEILEAGESSTRVLIAIVQKASVGLVGSAFHHHKLKVDRLTLGSAGWWSVLRRRPELKSPGRRVMLVAEGQSCDLFVADGATPVLIRSHALLEGLSPEEFARDISEETASAMTSLELEHGALPVTDFTVWMAPEAPASLPDALEAEGGWQVRQEPLSALGSLSDGIARQEEAGVPARLDLVPEAWRLEEKNGRIRRGLMLASIVALAVWGAAIAGILGWRQWQERQLADLEAQLARVKPAAEEVRDARKRVAALSLYGDMSRSALECLREIVSLMPEGGGVELGQFTFEKGKSISLAGEAPVPQPIYDFKKALDASALFYGTKLEGPVRSRNRETFRLLVYLQEVAE